jgi:hypothetical protein
MVVVMPQKDAANLAPVLFYLFVSVEEIGIGVGEDGARWLQIKKDCSTAKKRLNVSRKVFRKQRGIRRRKPPLASSPLQKGDYNLF